MTAHARTYARRAPLAVLAALALAACGATATPDDTAAPDDTGSATAAAPVASASASAPAADGGFPVTVASGQLPDTTELTIDEQPTSIVSISPTATEMLFAVGAGEQVVAVDAFSYYPAEAPVTDLSGYEPNLEAILGYSPDLVVSSGDPGDLVDGLEAAGVPTLLLPSALDIDEAYSQIERVGAATGHLADAVALTAQMEAEIAAAVESVDAPEDLTYYHELDATSFFTAGGDTFIGQVYGLFGLENITEAGGVTEDYPQLSPEFIITADPDLIFLPTGDPESAEELSARPGWEQVDAVENGDVVVLDADIASRWGPRIVDFAENVAGALAAIESVDAG